MVEKVIEEKRNKIFNYLYNAQNVNHSYRKQNGKQTSEQEKKFE